MEGLSRRQATPSFHLLPVGVWSAIGSYADALEAECDERNPSSLSALRCASSAFRSLLTSESYYRARVAGEICEWNDIDDSDSFCFRNKATRCPSAESVGGNENLLKIIAAYGPLRGWYRLRGSCDARPWELLVRVEFSGGRLCGHVAPEEDADLRTAVSAIREVPSST